MCTTLGITLCRLFSVFHNFCSALCFVFCQCPIIPTTHLFHWLIRLVLQLTLLRRRSEAMVLDDLEVFIPKLLEYELWELLADSFARSGAPILGSAALVVPPFNMVFSVYNSLYSFCRQSNMRKQRFRVRWLNSDYSSGNSLILMGLLNTNT